MLDESARIRQCLSASRSRFSRTKLTVRACLLFEDTEPEIRDITEGKCRHYYFGGFSIQFLLFAKEYS